MADLPKRPCRHQGCVEFALDGKRFCAKHFVEHERERKNASRERNGRADYQALYRTRRWQEMRKRKLEKSPVCEECMEYNVTRSAIHVDHIVPHNGNMALMYNEKNLRSLCASCHNAKTAREDGGFGNAVINREAITDHTPPKPKSPLRTM